MNPPRRGCMNKLVGILLAGALASMSGPLLAIDRDGARPGGVDARQSWLWSTGDFYPKRGWAEGNARKQREERESKRAPTALPDTDAAANPGVLQG